MEFHVTNENSYDKNLHTQNEILKVTVHTNNLVLRKIYVDNMIRLLSPFPFVIT